MNRVANEERFLFAARAFDAFVDQVAAGTGERDLSLHAFLAQALAYEGNR